MAIIVQCPEGWIIDHLKATERSYAVTVATCSSPFQKDPNRTESLVNSCVYVATSGKTNNTNVKDPFMKQKENDKYSMITVKTGARMCSADDNCDICLTKTVQKVISEDDSVENPTLDSTSHTVASTQDVTNPTLESTSHTVASTQDVTNPTLGSTSHTVASTQDVTLTMLDTSSHCIFFCEHNRESNCPVMQGTDISFRLKKDLFAIESPFIMDSQCHKQALDMIKTSDTKSHRKRKRKRNEELNPGEIAALERHEKIKSRIYQAYQQLLKESESSSYFGKFWSRGQAVSISSSNVMDNNRRARIVAEADGPGSLLATLCDAGLAHGGALDSTIINEVQHIKSSTGYVVDLLEHQFLMPPNSTFLLSDLSYIKRLTSVGKFDLIVMDPPWENKSVKRKKKYCSLTNEDLIHLPIPSLANEGCLVVVWVTNKQMHIRHIKDRLFPAWSVKWMAEWYWLKVTRSGEMVYDFDSPHKKPYETLVLGRYHQNAESLGTTRLAEPDDGKVIISVPCSIHSKKPPLDEVLRPYVPECGCCLELFARNLWPGWTSWGNEVLLHQHTDFYEQYCHDSVEEHRSDQCTA